MKRNVLADVNSPWMKMSRKLAQKIETAHFVGMFSQKDVEKREGVRLVQARVESPKEGFIILLFWLVDEWDGVIIDVRFQAFGHAALLGILEGVSELLIRKNYDQARKIQADLIDKHLRDKKDKEAISPEEYGSLNLVIDAIEALAQQCEDIHLPDHYVPTPMQASIIERSSYPGWEILSTEKQLAVIEEVIETEIRPYIELDAGGIEVVSFTEGKNLIIAYKGACTTCYSSTGSTLQAISQILQSKVHPQIQVIPDSSFLR